MIFVRALTALGGSDPFLDPLVCGETNSMLAYK